MRAFTSHAGSKSANKCNLLVLAKTFSWFLARVLLTSKGKEARVWLSKKDASEVISFNATASACQKGGQWQQALGAFQAIAKRHLELDIYSFGVANGGAGRWLQALGLFKTVFEAQVQVNEVTHLQSTGLTFWLSMVGSF